MKNPALRAPGSGPTVAAPPALLCRCGCGRPVTIRKGKPNHYVHGHNPRGKRLSAETRRRMSEAQTERHRRADEELERLNAAGYLNLTQVAEKRKVAPNTVSRWVAEGFLRPEPERHIVEQEHLYLVSLEELERFRGEDWPRIVRHVGSRRLPHWSPRSQQRWSGRANGRKGAPPQGYSSLQAKAVRQLHQDEGLGYKRLSKRTGLSVQQIRDILSEPEPKLCECGCGQPAPIAKGTSRRDGAVKGQPLRFVHGHNGRRGQNTPRRVF
jgi:hypothetical protein